MIRAAKVVVVAGVVVASYIIAAVGCFVLAAWAWKKDHL